MQDRIRNDYFNWLSDVVCRARYASQISYRKLLMRLHGIKFRYTIPKDKNRADDGENMRYRFAIDEGYEDVDFVIDILDAPCSVLEMMVALAMHCEECIMDDPRMGDRTGQWFWGMIVNLGLGSMTDDNYEKREVDKAIDRMLDRTYEANGKGGLFTVRNCKRDLRTVEIWYQLCWYLDTIT